MKSKRILEVLDVEFGHLLNAAYRGLGKLLRKKGRATGQRIERVVRVESGLWMLMSVDYLSQKPVSTRGRSRKRRRAG